MKLRGSGNSVINTFNKGLVTDVDPSSAVNGSYSYAENLRLLYDGASGTASNIEELTEAIQLPEDSGEFLAYYRTDKFTVLVSKYESSLKIWRYYIENNEDKCDHVATIIDSVDPGRIDRITHISVEASIESDKIHRIYFADGIHGIYSINLNSQGHIVSDDTYSRLWVDGVDMYPFLGTYWTGVVYQNNISVLSAGKYYKSNAAGNLQAPPSSDWTEIGSVTEPRFHIGTEVTGQIPVPYFVLHGETIGPSAGTYTASYTYEPNSVVMHNGSYWKALVSTSNEPGHADWLPVASVGELKYKIVDYQFNGDRHAFIWDSTDVGNYVGHWLPEFAYAINDVVWDNGNYYVSLFPNLNSDPSAAVAWSLICDDTENYTIEYIPGVIVEAQYLYDGPNFICKYIGTWVPTLDPTAGDAVDYGGNYYRAAVNYPFDEPGTSSNWTLVGSTTMPTYSIDIVMVDQTNEFLIKNTVRVGDFKGRHNPATLYFEDDCVLKSGKYYSSIETHSGEFDESKWIDLGGIHLPRFEVISTNVSAPNPDGPREYDVSKIEYKSASYSKPNVSLSADSNGSLLSGKYFYVVRYFTDSGSESSDMFVSGGINATIGGRVGGIVNPETGRPEASTTGVTLNISNIDDNAYGVNVYRIYYASAGVGFTANLIYSEIVSRVHGTAMPINIFDGSSDSVLMDVTDSILFNEKVNSVSVIDSKDNTLLAGDISLRNSGAINYDTRAFPFNSENVFKYRNSFDKVGETPHMINFFDLNSENSMYGLSGKDFHDFINDDIYSKDRYRDVLYRYKPIVINDNIEHVYGGAGKNVSYEFVHTHLIGVKPGSIFSNRSLDNNWYLQEVMSNGNPNIPGECNINNPMIRSNSSRTLLDTNIVRDNLTISYGDVERDIDTVSIKHQPVSNTPDSISNINISSFGISPHKGKFDYSNMAIANVFSGFKRNEIFRFAAKFKLTDGTYTDPMWISDIRFPANYMIKHGELDSSGDLFSFSSFVSGDDTKENIDLIREARMKPVTSISSGIRSLPTTFVKLSKNDINKAELIIKPLGIKFEFKNVPENVESVKILYSELDLLERTILGQFLVSRIGLNSTGSTTNTEHNRYFESVLDGFAFPHPTPSMKYSYGIMPMTTAAWTSYDATVSENGSMAGLNMRTASRLGFGDYSMVASPVCGRDGSPGDHLFVDHRLARTSAVSTSPYFSDINTYLLASPSISYFGESFADILDNLKSSLVFENLIYTKNSAPFQKSGTNNGTGTTHGFTFPVTSRDYILNNSIDGHAGTASLLRSIYTGESNMPGVIPSKPFNYNDGSYHDVSKFLESGPIQMLGALPTLMYTGAFFTEEERISSESDNCLITLSGCGPTTYGILESVLWFKRAPVSQTVKTSSGNFTIRDSRLGDSIFKVRSYGDKMQYMTANRWTEGLASMPNMPNMNVSTNVDLPGGKSLFPDNYEVGRYPSNFTEDNYEKMWDSNLNIPVSIKTFMSGLGYLSSYKDSYGNHISIYLSGIEPRKYPGLPDSMDEYNFTKAYNKIRLRPSAIKHSNLSSANSTTLKYFKSIIPCRASNSASSNPSLVTYGVNENDRYVSFFKQNSRKFSDYHVGVSGKDCPSIHQYNPLLDNELNISFGIGSIWDFEPIRISRAIPADVNESPVSPFSLSSYSRLPGYVGYINYSRSLSKDLYGFKTKRNLFFASDDKSSYSMLSGLPFRYTYDDPKKDLTFITAHSVKRGRISGKHGAGVLVSLADSIPMVGHMLNIDNSLDGLLNSSIKNSIDLALSYQSQGLISNYNSMVDKIARTRLYWHMLDGACSAHTSTYLVDIKSRSNKLLSTASYSDKKNTKYIESAQSINLGTETNHSYYVFGGGTYVTLFDYTSTYGNKPEPHISYDNDPEKFENWNSTALSCNTCRINLLVPIESDINTHVDSGHVNHREFSPWSLDKVYPGVNSPNSGYSETPIVFSQDIDEHVYNEAYSAKNNFNSIENNYSKDSTFNTHEYRSRIIASEKKTTGEQLDSWSMFKPMNYIDLNTANGPITGLVSVGNRMFALQPEAVSAISVNERALITDQNNGGTQLLLGTGRILDHSVLVSNKNGLPENSKSMLYKGANGAYFFDSINNEICAITEGVSSLSARTMTKLLCSSVMTNISSGVFGWNKYNEILFNFGSAYYNNNDNRTLAFNERAGFFESFFTYEYNFGFELGSGVRLVSKNGDNSFIYKPGISPTSEMIVEFSVNPDISQSKIFDSIEVNLSSTHGKLSSNNLEIEAKYRNSISDTGDFKSITMDSMSRQDKNAGLFAAIPRVDGTISKMRDRYLMSMYKFIGGVHVTLPYVKTNYRYSVT